MINEGDYGGCYFWVVKGIFDVIQEEFAAIMMDRLEETRQWLEDERRRIDKKYAELLASKKRLQGRLVKKF